MGPAEECHIFSFKKGLFRHKIIVDDLNGRIVPGHIVEPKIVRENENDMGLPVVIDIKELWCML